MTDDTNGVGTDIIIEASDSKESWERLSKIGSNVSGFWDFCGCCGERWFNFDDGELFPHIYEEPVNIVKEGIFRKECFIHFLDGTFKKHTFI